MVIPVVCVSVIYALKIKLKQLKENDVFEMEFDGGKFMKILIGLILMVGNGACGVS